MKCILFQVYYILMFFIKVILYSINQTNTAKKTLNTHLWLYSGDAKIIKDKTAMHAPFYFAFS